MSKIAIKTFKPTPEQRQRMEALAQKMLATLEGEEDEDVVAVAIANVISGWLMSYQSHDLEAVVLARGEIFKRLVEHVGEIVARNIAWERDRTGHA